jgi:hypothetical protein
VHHVRGVGADGTPVAPFVVDGRWSSVGTTNFDNRSLALNEEVTPMVLDAEFGATMNVLFLDDVRHAEEITLAAFRERPCSERIVEKAAHRVSPGDPRLPSTSVPGAVGGHNRCIDSRRGVDLMHSGAVERR